MPGAPQTYGSVRLHRGAGRAEPSAPSAYRLHARVRPQRAQMLESAHATARGFPGERDRTLLHVLAAL